MKQLIATTLLAVAFASAALVAQTPVPKALLEAKTAYLVSDGAGQATIDGIAKEFQKWGRFTLVDDAAKSDVTIAIGGIHYFSGWAMTITTSSQDHTVLWKDVARVNVMTGSKIPKKLVENLRKRLEKTGTGKV